MTKEEIEKLKQEFYKQHTWLYQNDRDDVWQWIKDKCLNVQEEKEDLICSCGSNDYEKNKYHDSIRCNSCGTIYTTI